MLLVGIDGSITYEFFLLSVFGQLLGSLSYGLNYIFLKELDWHFLFVELIIDICGGSVTYYMMEYSYITDITQVSTCITIRSSYVK